MDNDEFTIEIEESDGILEVFRYLEKSFISKIENFCVYFKTEAIVEDTNRDVFLVKNNCVFQIPDLSGGIEDFVYSHLTFADGTMIYHMLALTKGKLIFGWGKNHFNQVRNQNFQSCKIFLKIFYQDLCI